MLVYILSQALPALRKRYLYKEVWVGLIYTAGVWGLPFLFRGVQPDLSHVFLVPAFLCIVLVNVLSYSWFEFPADSREKLQTLAVWHGTKICGILIRVLLIITVILVITGLYFFHSEPERIIAFVILLVMASLLGLVHLFSGFFRKHERFGKVADAVFILPALIVLF